MNEQQAYLAIRNTIRLEDLSVKTASRITPELTRIFDWLGQQIRALPDGSIEREQQYRALQQQIASIFRPANAQFYVELRRALDAEVIDQVNYAQEYLQKAEGTKGGPVPREALSVDGAAVQPIQITRTQLQAISRETEVLGVRLETLFGVDDRRSAWIKDNLKLVDQTVKRGFLLGSTNEQIASELPGVDRVARMRNRAVARTAVMDMSANAQEAFWQANRDVIAGWEFDASMDNRVCPTCAPWDGRSGMKRTDLPKTPVHVNCRCRVLPLTETELALRKEEGPQRRSVIELVEADSKEAALAKAKQAPNVTSARAYANQVKVDGKMYWRVSKDIRQPDHPLTMGEFLKQASPATQAQVLGGPDKRDQFVWLVTGTKKNPAVTPDEALRRVTDFRDRAEVDPARSNSALQGPRVRAIPRRKKPGG